MACRRKAFRSSAVKSVFALRTGWFTTPTTTRSKTRRGPLDDVEVAVRDRVVGPGADRDASVGGHLRHSIGRGGSRSACRRIAVRRSRGRSNRSGCFGRALANDARLGRQHRRQKRPECRPKAGRESIRRVAAAPSPTGPRGAPRHAGTTARRRGTPAPRPTPTRSRFSRTARAAAGSESTNVALRAPRESASIPSAPEPA